MLHTLLFHGANLILATQRLCISSPKCSPSVRLNDCLGYCDRLFAIYINSYDPKGTNYMILCVRLDARPLTSSVEETRCPEAIPEREPIPHCGWFFFSQLHTIVIRFICSRSFQSIASELSTGIYMPLFSIQSCNCIRNWNGSSIAHVSSPLIQTILHFESSKFTIIVRGLSQSRP